MSITESSFGKLEIGVVLHFSYGSKSNVFSSMMMRVRVRALRRVIHTRVEITSNMTSNTREGAKLEYLHLWCNFRQIYYFKGDSNDEPPDPRIG